MTDVLLDTNALFAMACAPNRLGPKSSKLLQAANNLLFSSVSVAEMNFKMMLGKIRLSEPIEKLAISNGLEEVPFDSDAAHQIFRFQSLVRHDPFDRMILATASAKNAKLVTSDRTLLGLGFDWILDSAK